MDQVNLSASDYEWVTSKAKGRLARCTQQTQKPERRKERTRNVLELSRMGARKGKEEEVFKVRDVALNF